MIDNGGPHPFPPPVQRPLVYFFHIFEEKSFELLSFLEPQPFSPLFFADYDWNEISPPPLHPPHFSPLAGHYCPPFWPPPFGVHRPPHIQTSGGRVFLRSCPARLVCKQASPLLAPVSLCFQPPWRIHPDSRKTLSLLHETHSPVPTDASVSSLLNLVPQVRQATLPRPPQDFKNFLSFFFHLGLKPSFVWWSP